MLNVKIGNRNNNINTANNICLKFSLQIILFYLTRQMYYFHIKKKQRID